MNVQIQTTKIELTDAIKSYAQEKMNMLLKYLGDVEAQNCDVHLGLSVGGQHHGEIFFCEVNLNLPHKLLTIKKEEEDLYKAIDKVKDHLEREIVEYKEKRQR